VYTAARESTPILDHPNPRPLLLLDRLLINNNHWLALHLPRVHQLHSIRKHC